MKYNLTSVPSLKSSDCLVVGVLGTDSFPFNLSDDKQHTELFTRLRNKLKKAGDCVWQTDIEGSSLLLIHCGLKATFNIDTLNKRINDIAGYLFKEQIHSATICMPQLSDQTPDWQIEHMLLQIEQARYQLLDFKTDKENQHGLSSILFFLPGAQDLAITNAHTIAQCITYTRTLANLPANVCTPTYLAQQATELAKQHPALKTKIFAYDEIKKMGMGTFLAVAQGSKEPPYFIEIQYKGKSDKPPVVLVGKGVTFDSGGLSLKPSEAMVEMKYDMAGAASVLGTLKACALLQLPIHVVGLIPCTENMLSGGAIKPGDIVTSMSGQTVEIINTDAEGRLILADALTYAERFNPTFVIDIATLTGAVIIALGGINTGLMTNDESLAESILNAARTSNDKTWRLPLDEAYQDAIDSPLADMLNANFDRTAGSITAACFLSRFTKKYRWAHLDVAGTAWISGKKRNATGRPVPLLIELLRHVANSR